MMSAVMLLVVPSSRVPLALVLPGASAADLVADAEVADDHRNRGVAAEVGGGHDVGSRAGVLAADDEGVDVDDAADGEAVAALDEDLAGAVLGPVLVDAPGHVGHAVADDVGARGAAAAAAALVAEDDVGGINVGRAVADVEGADGGAAGVEVVVAEPQLAAGGVGTEIEDAAVHHVDEALALATADGPQVSDDRVGGAQGHRAGEAGLARGGRVAEHDGVGLDVVALGEDEGADGLVLVIGGTELDHVHRGVELSDVREVHEALGAGVAADVAADRDLTSAAGADVHQAAGAAEERAESAAGAAAVLVADDEPAQVELAGAARQVEEAPRHAAGIVVVACNDDGDAVAVAAKGEGAAGRGELHLAAALAAADVEGIGVDGVGLAEDEGALLACARLAGAGRVADADLVGHGQRVVGAQDEGALGAAAVRDAEEDVVGVDGDRAARGVGDRAALAVVADAEVVHIDSPTDGERLIAQDSERAGALAVRGVALPHVATDIEGAIAEKEGAERAARAAGVAFLREVDVGGEDVGRAGREVNGAAVVAASPGVLDAHRDLGAGAVVAQVDDAAGGEVHEARRLVLADDQGLRGDVVGAAAEVELVARAAVVAAAAHLDLIRHDRVVGCEGHLPPRVTVAVVALHADVEQVDVEVGGAGATEVDDADSGDAAVVAEVAAHEEVVGRRARAHGHRAARDVEGCRGVPALGGHLEAVERQAAHDVHRPALHVEAVQARVHDPVAGVAAGVGVEAELGGRAAASDGEVGRAGDGAGQLDGAAVVAAHVDRRVGGNVQVAAHGHRAVADPAGDSAAVEAQVVDRHRAAVLESKDTARQHRQGVAGERRRVAHVVRRAERVGGLVVVAGVGGQTVAPVLPVVPGVAAGHALRLRDETRLGSAGHRHHQSHRRHPDQSASSRRHRRYLLLARRQACRNAGPFTCSDKPCFVFQQSACHTGPIPAESCDDALTTCIVTIYTPSPAHGRAQAAQASVGGC